MSEINHIAEIAKAISSVMKAVEPVAKRGKNSFHNYEYATAADLVHAIQKPMADAGLVVIHSEAERKVMEALLEVTFDFHIATITGAVWPHPIRATGIAAARTSKGGPDDKAWNKCLTAAHKYFLLTLFKVPTGDFPDSDADGDAPHEERQQKAEPPKTQQQKVPSDKEAVGAAVSAIKACRDLVALNQLWSMSAAAWRAEFSAPGFDHVSKVKDARKAELQHTTSTAEMLEDEIPF